MAEDRACRMQLQITVTPLVVFVAYACFVGFPLIEAMAVHSIIFYL